jgi:hypothetical protein
MALRLVPCSAEGPDLRGFGAKYQLLKKAVKAA